MTTSVDLDGVSAAWDLDDLQPAEDKGDRISGVIVAQSTASEPTATPAESAPAAAAEPVPVDVGSGTPVQPGATAPGTSTPLEYTADASNVVKLPANVSIENIRVEGSDLVLEQADGTLITIKDAAANVPTFIIGDVEVPRVALLAALGASGVDVAFGADGSIAASPASNLPNSSGGNFEVPPGGIGDGFALTDLLPPTALAFPRYEGRELYPSFEDEENEPPTVTIDTDNPGNANDQVDEAGLGPNGSDAASDSEFATGTFTLSDGNGLDDLVSVTINGTTVAISALAGSPFAGDHGTLRITGYDAATGVATYKYELTKATTDGPSIEQDSFSVTVSDSSGPSLPATIIIEIVDDKPVAENDTNSIGEDAASVGGNVLTNDVAGADGGKTVTTPGSYVGTYGTLQLNADGSYTYTLKTDAATQAVIQALNPGQTLPDAFGYTMRDGDGDTDTATLTITIAGADDGVTINGLAVAGGEETVYENDLPAGTTPDAAALTQTGTFTLSAPDGIATIQIGAGAPFSYAQLAASGTTPLVIDSPQGVLDDHRLCRHGGRRHGILQLYAGHDGCQRGGVGPGERELRDGGHRRQRLEPTATASTSPSSTTSRLRPRRRQQHRRGCGERRRQRFDQRRCGRRRRQDGDDARAAMSGPTARCSSSTRTAATPIR